MTQLTKNALMEAFIRLLGERPLDQITVRDIAGECGVSRNTFYYHFGDVYALLEALLRREMDRLMKERREGETGGEGLRRLFGWVAGHQRIANHIYSGTDPTVLEHLLFHTTEQVFMAYILDAAKGLDAAEDDLRFMCYAYQSMFVGMLMEWIRQGMRGDPTELMERAQRLILRNTRRMLAEGGEQRGR